MNISLLNEKSIITRDNNIVKVISEEGIKIFNNTSDAIKNVNPSKVYNKLEALNFISGAFKGDAINGSEKAISAFNNFMDKWKKE